MRAFPTYPRTKPTAIPWIGELPEHWEVKQFKYIFREHGGNGFPHEDQGVDEGELPFFKVGDLSGRGKGVATTSNWTSRANALARNWNVVPKGAIISPKIGESLRKNNRKLALVDCLIDNNCVAHEPIDADGDFAFFLLSLIDFGWYVNPGAVPSVSLSKLRGSTIAVPPLPEQTHIARYLSHKTALIDAYLARKRRMMALLKEQRQALISQAVTKGLDHNAPMKDSGMEWIGEVPEHWEVRKLAWLVESDNAGEVIDKNWWGEGFELLYTCAREPLQSDFAGFPEDKRTRPRDLLLTRNGTPYVHLPETGSIYSNVVQRITPIQSLDREYLAMSLGEACKNIIGYGVSIVSLNYEMWKALRIPLPPLEELKNILKGVRTKSSLIDDELTRIEASMECVREYRQALISAVVTGKVDVRGVEVPEIDQTMSGSEDQTMEEEAGRSAVDVLEEDA